MFSYDKVDYSFYENCQFQTRKILDQITVMKRFCIKILINIERKLVPMERYRKILVLYLICGWTLASFISLSTLSYDQYAFAFAPSNPPSTETPSPSPSPSESTSESTAPNIVPPSSEPTDDNKSAFLEYENSTYGVKIQYPADWETYTQADAMYSSGKYIIGFNSPDRTTSLNIETEESTKDLEEYAKKYNDLPEIQIVDSESGPSDLNGNPAYELVYTSNSQDTKIKHLFEKVGDKFTENLVVSFQEISDPSMTAEKYVEQAISFYKEYYDEDPKFIDKNTTMVNISGNNYPAYTLIYTEDIYNDKDNPVITAERGYIIGDKAYTFQYARNNQSTFASYLPIVDDMINSFELIRSTEN